MTFEEFDALAHEMFDEIPPEYRQGVDAIVTSPDAPEHPELEEIYTLGECLSESLPTDFPGPDDMRSYVMLYHGSFERIAERDPEFDYETEMWNTITHEIRHHIEYRAEDDTLGLQDYAEEQNFARRMGEPFEVFFYRTGVPHGEGAFEVDGDLFVERTVDGGESRVELAWSEGSVRVRLPDPLGDIHFVTADTDAWPRGEVVGVLLRRRSFWEKVGAVFRGGPTVLHSVEEAVSG